MLVIGRLALRIVMEGVRTVRVVTVLAVVSVLAGVWMVNSSNGDESIGLADDDSVDEEVAFAEAAPEEDSREGDGGENPDAKQGQDEEEGDGELPGQLIAGGAGALGSLLIGSVFLESVKVTVLVALVSPMLARIKSNREDMLTRGRLLGYLEANPGIHFSALRDALGLANGVTAYHLNFLESSGQIISWRDGKLRRYAISSLTKEEVSKIKNPISGTRLAIMEVLADTGNLGMSGPDIRKKLQISRQLLSHHLSELRSGGMIEAASVSRRPNWKVSDSGLDALTASKEVARIESVA
ncbi:MAG: winged helix-turn-helix transcriptional regulator [Candidatus Thermoplasmatota archaeon]|nr:winged helix-turn-helix transcriptional regulator [Candidatus Thermoplasmatota archaeon]